MLATRLPGAISRPDALPCAHRRVSQEALRRAPTASSQRSPLMTDTPSPEDRDNPTTTPEPDKPDVSGNGDPSTEEATAEAAVAADAPGLDDARSAEEIPTV